ncbi:MAG: bifunctional enoyl-CoA hydratase/phosphate acetyltransferase [Planctomycetota bacterium]|jgi:phosphate butyryltransferase
MARGERTLILKKHARKVTRFDELFDIVASFPKKRVAVAVPHHSAVLESVREADARNLADAILVGDEARIRRAADEAEYEVDPARIVHVPRIVDAAREAARLVHDGEADIFMKGHLHTDDFLRAVLDREKGLRTKAVMSHVFVWEATDLFGRLVFVTDASMNIAPDLVTKADILLNAVHLAGMFGVEGPRVAILAAVELVNPKMPATVEAGSLGKMCERRQFSTTCSIDGPLALDNALSERAARVKGIKGDVAGRADILLVPDIEAGNVLAKSFTYLAGGRMAGVVVGAAAPVVLTSRADSAENKLYSMAVAVLMSAFERDLELKIGKVHF